MIDHRIFRYLQCRVEKNMQKQVWRCCLLLMRHDHMRLQIVMYTAWLILVSLLPLFNAFVYNLSGGLLQMKMSIKIASLVLLLAITSLVSANEFTAGRDKNSVQAVQSLEAYAKYKMAQYEEARNIWLMLAEDNNASAIINLANLYEQGQGVERDLEQATKWLKKAAVLDDARGQYQLAMAYEKGLGVERDLHKAAHWLEKAAEQGDEIAQFSLGVMLATNYGEGLTTSTKEQRLVAIKWLSMADENDVEDAKAFLSLLSGMM